MLASRILVRYVHVVRSYTYTNIVWCISLYMWCSAHLYGRELSIMCMRTMVVFSPTDSELRKQSGKLHMAWSVANRGKSSITGTLHMHTLGAELHTCWSVIGPVRGNCGRPGLLLVQLTCIAQAQCHIVSTSSVNDNSILRKLIINEDIEYLMLVREYHFTQIYVIVLFHLKMNCGKCLGKHRCNKSVGIMFAVSF